MTIDITDEEREFLLMLVRDSEVALVYEARNEDAEEQLARLVGSLTTKLSK